MRTKIPLIVSLAIFLSITISSCDLTQNEDGPTLVDVEQLGQTYHAKYDKVSEDIAGVDDAEEFASSFKKAALKHFDGIEKGDQQYDQASQNYDDSFSYASKFQFRDDTHLLRKESNDPFAELVEQVKSSSTLELDNVFDDFYVSVKEDNDISTEAKNNLLAKAVFYEETINFIENNKDNLNFSSAKPIKTDVKNRIAGGWWECAVGVAGEAIVDGLGGCGIGSIPSLGLGCGAGATIGVIGGALKGAADHCF